MRIENVPIDQVKLDPGNARRHGQRSIDAIAASLNRFGQQKPIVIDAQGIVRAGNGTLAAAKQLGWEWIKAVRSELSGDELAAYAIADNRVADLSEFDPAALGELLAELENIESLGFDAEDLEKIVNGALNDSAAENSPPEPFPLPPENRPRGLDGDSQLPMGQPISLTADQREGVNVAFARFRELHQGNSRYRMSDGQIVVLICADWMAGN